MIPGIVAAVRDSASSHWASQNAPSGEIWGLQRLSHASGGVYLWLPSQWVAPGCKCPGKTSPIGTQVAHAPSARDDRRWDMPCCGLRARPFAGQAYRLAVVQAGVGERTPGHVERVERRVFVPVGGAGMTRRPNRRRLQGGFARAGLVPARTGCRAPGCIRTRTETATPRRGKPRRGVAACNRCAIASGSSARSCCRRSEAARGPPPLRSADRARA